MNKAKIEKNYIIVIWCQNVEKKEVDIKNSV